MKKAVPPHPFQKTFIYAKTPAGMNGRRFFVFAYITCLFHKVFCEGVKNVNRNRRKIFLSPRTFCLFWALLLFDRQGILLPTLLAAFVHECGHLLAARLLKIPLRSLSLDFLGARLSVSGRLLSYGEEWLLAASGPLFSLVGAVLGACLWSASPFFISFSCASLLLGLLNLAPIRSFDGGRMLGCCLSLFLEPEQSDRVLQWSSCFCLLFGFAAATYFLLRAGEGAAFFFFSASLFFRFLGGGKNEIF